MGKHDHVTGRPRDYISRKWFYRGKHRPNGHRETVEEICAGIDRRDHSTPGWHVSADGKFYIANVTIHVPDDPNPVQHPVMMIAPPNGELTNFPALTEVSRDELLNERGIDDGDVD